MGRVRLLNTWITVDFLFIHLKFYFNERGIFFFFFKKSKAFLAAFLAAVTASSAIMPTVASAERTKEEAYGTDTYAARFMSLYDDVITNGIDNGYMSSTSTVNGGLGVPYHSVEELCIEAPDYGHETTSEAMSYMAWVTAMHDVLANKGVISGSGNNC